VSFALPHAQELFSWVAAEGGQRAQRRILSKAEGTVCFLHIFPVIKMLFFLSKIYNETVTK